MRMKFRQVNLINKHSVSTYKQCLRLQACKLKFFWLQKEIYVLTLNKLYGYVGKKNYGFWKFITELQGKFLHQVSQVIKVCTYEVRLTGKVVDLTHFL